MSEVLRVAKEAPVFCEVGGPECRNHPDKHPAPRTKVRCTRCHAACCHGCRTSARLDEPGAPNALVCLTCFEALARTKAAEKYREAAENPAWPLITQGRVALDRVEPLSLVVHNPSARVFEVATETTFPEATVLMRNTPRYGTYPAVLLSPTELSIRWLAKHERPTAVQFRSYPGWEAVASMGKQSVLIALFKRHQSRTR